MNTATTSQARPRPTTVEELLGREEALAIQQIVGSVQRMADDVLVTTDLREQVRQHPGMALSLSALLGFVAAPLLGRAARRALSATVKGRSLNRLPPQTLHELLMASLRTVGAPR